MKKLISLICAAVILITSVSVLGGLVTVSADTATTEWEYEEKIEGSQLTFNDFSEAPASSNHYSGYQYRLGDLYPLTDPTDETNHVLVFRKSRFGNHRILFGEDYKSGTSLRNGTASPTPVKGATYEVSLDYYLENGDAVDTNDIIIHAAIGQVDAVTADGSNPDNTALKTLFETYDWKTELFRIKADEANSTDFKNLKATFTIPGDITVSEGSKLMLYIEADIATYASKGKSVYFDNVKLSKLVNTKSTILGYHSFENTRTYDSKWSAPFQFMVDAFPVYDPLDSSNKVIRYVQGHNKGYIVIGEEMLAKSNGNIDVYNGVPADAGKTYNIQFDYYITGSTDGLGTKVLLSASSLKGGGDKADSWVSDIPVLELPKNSNVATGEWVRNYKASITIPEGTTITDGHTLQLKLKDGGTKTVLYIDNVKITTDTVTSDYISAGSGVITNNDFSEVPGDRGPYSGYHYRLGDLWPSVWPADSTNDVLLLGKFRYGNHRILLGEDYENGTSLRNGTASPTPVKGATYELSLDYYLINNATTPDTKDIIIYAAIGQLDAVTADGSNPDNTALKTLFETYDWETEIFRIKADEADSTDFKNLKVTFTIPSDITISEGSKLMLHINADQNNYNSETGVGRRVYFDNIKLSAPNFMTVAITTDSDYSSKLYNADEFSLDNLYPIDVINKKAVRWYTDANCTTDVGYEAIKDDLPLHLELYGKYERADAPYVFGDLDNDGKVGDGDTVKLRKYMLGISEMVSNAIKSDINNDSMTDIRDLLRSKKGIENLSGYKLTFGDGITTKNQALAAEYFGENVAEAEKEISFNITGSTTKYSVFVEGNKITVNGGSENALAAGIISLHSYIATGRELNDGCLIEFDYIGKVYPTEIEGNEEIYSDDFVTSKESILMGQVEISNSAGTIEYNALSSETQQLGTDFVNEIKDNIVSDFQKDGDMMVHVSSFVIIDNVVYMSYYANETTKDETPLYQKARLVTAPLNDLGNKTFYDIQSFGDECGGKRVDALYDTILMHKDGTIYVMWTASLSGNYYRLYRTYDIATKEFGDVKINKFTVGDITNDFSISGMKSALAENEIAYKDMHVDIGIMQKLSTRVENGETYYYTGAYCGYFTCIIKSKDLINWEYVAQPTFDNESKWENATYVVGDKVYYFVRQMRADNSLPNYGFLTAYDLVNETWADPVLVRDSQSRSDFIEYNGELYLIHDPASVTTSSVDGYNPMRTGVGILKIDKENLANSTPVLQADMESSCFYPFVQYALGEDGQPDTSVMYMSYTINRKQIRLVKFDPSKYLK